MLSSTCRKHIFVHRCELICAWPMPMHSQTLCCKPNECARWWVSDGKQTREVGRVTWHCCGPPCLVGESVFGLCFFTIVDDKVTGEFRLDVCVLVAARVVMVSACCVATTIDVFFERWDAFKPTVSSTLVDAERQTKKKMTQRGRKLPSPF